MIIKNGRVIDPRSGFDGIADIIIKDGKIDKIVKKDGSLEQAGKDAAPWDGGGNPANGADRAENAHRRPEGTDSAEDTDEIIDASGLIVGPGLVDVHVHFRDPGLTYKEDIDTGAASAKAGGFTTVVMMANTRPTIDNEETLRYVLEKGKRTGIHVLSSANITRGMKGKELTDMESLRALGAAGFTDDGVPIMDVKLLAEAMERAKKLDVPLSFHEEDPGFIINNGINRGEVSKKLGIGGSPRVAEDSLVARDCMIALYTGACVNIQHISSKNAVAAVALAKKLGADVWAEVTPHHLTLNETAVLEHGTLAKMNPPLRTEEDRLALIEALKDGTIDMIATDHAPHSREEKEKPLIEAPSGIIGLETALPLAVTELVKKGHLTYAALFEKMCLNPARLYRLDTGYLAEGGPADLVIFDDRREFAAGPFASKSSNSPFTGRRMYGKVKATVCGGKVVYRESGGDRD